VNFPVILLWSEKIHCPILQALIFGVNLTGLKNDLTVGKALFLGICEGVSGVTPGESKAGESEWT
jgi:hypothetical protein